MAAFVRLAFGLKVGLSLSAFSSCAQCGSYMTTMLPAHAAYKSVSLTCGVAGVGMD